MSGVLYIFAYLIPILAVIFTLATFFVKDNILPPLFSSILWFISSFTTSNIVFVNNFEASASPTYTSLGNPEFSYLYLGLGVLMALYSLLLVISIAREMSSGMGGDEQ